MTEQEKRKQFMNQLRANINEYKKFINSDVNTQMKLDAKNMGKDWKNIGNDIKLAIEKNIENEK